MKALNTKYEMLNNIKALMTKIQKEKGFGIWIAVSQVVSQAVSKEKTKEGLPKEAFARKKVVGVVSTPTAQGSNQPWSRSGTTSTTKLRYSGSSRPRHKTMNIGDTFRAVTRPIVTIIFAAVIAQVIVEGIEPPEWFVGLAITVIGWWFVDRTRQHIKERK
jgi:hypothetical protein